MFKNLEIIDYIKSIEKEIENKQLKNILKNDIIEVVENEDNIFSKASENLEFHNIIKSMNNKELNTLNFIFDHYKFTTNHFKGDYRIKLDYIEDFSNFIKNILILFFIFIKFNDILDISNTINININVMLFCNLILLIISIILYFLKNKYIKNIKLIDKFQILLDYYKSLSKDLIKFL